MRNEHGGHAVFKPLFGCEQRQPHWIVMQTIEAVSDIVK
jgi:hypothetical protein